MVLRTLLFGGLSVTSVAAPVSVVMGPSTKVMDNQVKFRRLINSTNNLSDSFSMDVNEIHNIVDQGSNKVTFDFKAVNYTYINSYYYSIETNSEIVKSLDGTYVNAELLIHLPSDFYETLVGPTK